jgi:hypothetical protein
LQVLVDYRSKDVEMQGTTEVPALVVQSNLLEALAIDEYPGKISSEKEEADVVVAEPVSEEKGAKGWALRHTWVVAILLVLIVAAIVAAIVDSTMVSSKNGTHLVSGSSLDGRVGPVLRCGIDHSRAQHNVVEPFVGYILSSIQRRTMVVRGRWFHCRFH